MSSLPTTYKKVQVVKKVTDPKEALAVSEHPMPTPGPGEALCRVRYAGVNATDMNSFLGSYSKPGQGEVPFDCGLEALVEIVAVGDGVPANCTVGAMALGSGLGWFTEYRAVRAVDLLYGVSEPGPRFLTVPISAMTAAVALGELAGTGDTGFGPKAGSVALVTAAAGGTGQFAVQWLKKVCGCTVIGTCSSDEKVAFLKSLGCDRPINYKTESIGDVLKAEFPKGVDVVYESVGGDTFEVALRSLAPKGRFIVIGSVTGYKDQTAFQRDAGSSPIQLQLLRKSATMSGFMLPMFGDVFPKYLAKLLPMVTTGELQCHIDATKSFVGAESVADAVAHLHTGSSFGKVVVKMT